MQLHREESRKHREAFWAQGILEIQCRGFNLMEGEEITLKQEHSKPLASPQAGAPLVLRSRQIAGRAITRGTWRKRWSTKSPWTP